MVEQLCERFFLFTEYLLLFFSFLSVPLSTATGGLERRLQPRPGLQVPVPERQRLRGAGGGHGQRPGGGGGRAEAVRPHGHHRPGSFGVAESLRTGHLFLFSYFLFFGTQVYR